MKFRGKTNEWIYFFYLRKPSLLIDLVRSSWCSKQVSPSEDNVSIHADNRVAPLKGKPPNILAKRFSRWADKPKVKAFKLIQTLQTVCSSISIFFWMKSLFHIQIMLPNVVCHQQVFRVRFMKHELLNCVRRGFMSFSVTISCLPLQRRFLKVMNGRLCGYIQLISINSSF